MVGTPGWDGGVEDGPWHWEREFCGTSPALASARGIWPRCRAGHGPGKKDPSQGAVPGCRKEQQSNPVSHPSLETPDSHSPAIPGARAAPSVRFPPSRSLEMLWGAFRGGRFILPRGNRIIDLPSSPRGNPVSFPCSGGEEVSGLVLTVPGGQWIPREGNPPSSPGGSPFPKRFPQGPPIAEGAMGPQFQSPFWVGVLVLAGEGPAAPAHRWCHSKASLIQH